MDTENSTNLYLQACQTLLTCDYDDPSTFSDLYKLLPWLRQSLTCCVCSKVIKDPMSSTESSCQHFICTQCKGKPMILKPSCSWCKDSSYFEKNPHLSILVLCFSKICEYIYNSPIMKHFIKFEEEQQKLIQETRVNQADDCVKDGKMVRKKNNKRRKNFPSRSRKRQLVFSVTQAVNDGLELKNSLSQWLDKNINASSDTTAMTPAFLQQQVEDTGTDYSIHISKEENQNEIVDVES